ncbi:MAG TPA: hypothetical protein VF655_12790 [Allosphingosinicella sp.]|jgi:hypothetical protein
MNGALEILRREREDAAEQIRALRLRIRDLDAAISVLEDQPLATKPGRSGGDLKSTVLKQLLEDFSGGGTPKELADALTRQGRATSDASVSSTLSRLKGESKVINRNGRWFAANRPADAFLSESADPDFGHSAGWDDLDEEVPF